MKLAFVTAGLVAALAGCGDNLDGGTPAPTSCVPGCAGARGYDAISYDLHGSWDWSGKKLTASEDIVLDTTTSGAVVELDAAVAVTRVHAGTQDLAFELDKGKHTLTVDVTPVGVGAMTAFTVEYSAVSDGTSSQTSASALIATTSSANDPVQSRVVYTDSEPDRALYWLVTDLDPADRALWSVDMAIDAGEDVVANGTRGADTMVDGRRVVAYALAKPIPTYLMAFAAGELEHTDRPASGGLVPLSVWYRRGLVLDPQITLDEVASAMATFNSEIMPYPWETYSVVLLPYGGGMENATITFNDETSGQGPGDLALNAHELAHHWFGDWVTMNRFEDVWFKEGLATIFESEAERANRDAGHAGRLWASDFGFNAADAIVDPSLHSLDKYTSGPYQHAAWVITQIRATVGETAFFDGLRALLAAHAVGSATGEQLIRSFPLDEATVQKLLASLPTKDIPALTATEAAAGADSTLTLTLADPGAQMIAPLDFSVVDVTGAVVAHHLVPGTPLVVTVPAGGYLGTDERDVHPPLYDDFGLGDAAYATVSAHLAPAAPAAAAVLAAFDARSAAQQEKAGEIALLPIALPTQFAAYYASLDSDLAKNQAVIAACGQAAQDPTWLPVLEPAIEAPARADFDPGFAACSSVYAMATLEPELKAALTAATPASLARAEYLMSFDYGADTTTLMTGIESTAPSLRLREIAQQRLQINGNHKSPRGHRTSTRLRAMR